MPQSSGFERVVEIPILLTSEGTFPPVSFWGRQTPATGVNKCSNPDEGTSNEVSSLANEKFITVPVTSMALKGKQYLLALGLPTGSRQTVLALWGYGLKRFDSLRVQINNRR